MQLLLIDLAPRVGASQIVPTEAVANATATPSAMGLPMLEKVKATVRATTKELASPPSDEGRPTKFVSTH